MTGAIDLDFASIVELRPDLTVTELDGEVVIVDGAGGRYHVAGATGSRIISLLGPGRTVAAIVGDLCAAYDVDEDVCGRDVLAFLHALQAQDLLVLAG